MGTMTKTTATKTAAAAKAKAETIAKIARETLRIETLERRNSDALDFHERSVMSIEKALAAAYEAGIAAAKGTK